MRRLQIRKATALVMVLLSGSAWAASPEAAADGDFEKLHTLIKRQPGESRWMEIDWYPTVWEARKKAAEEGKPLFLMAGSGGAPAAGC